MKIVNVKKLCIAGTLVAVGVICSAFSIPIGIARCFPIQHMINVIAGVFLGPVYAVCMAFATSCIRIMLGTGTLLAFPGSMCGALLCGLAYKYTRKYTFAYVGEVMGTGILGALLAYPVGVLLMGREMALFAMIIPFSVSTIGGTLIAVMLTAALVKSRVFDKITE